MDLRLNSMPSSSMEVNHLTSFHHYLSICKSPKQCGLLASLIGDWWEVTILGPCCQLSRELGTWESETLREYHRTLSCSYSLEPGALGHQLFYLWFELVPKREEGKTWLKDIIEITLLVTVHSTSVWGELITGPQIAESIIISALFGTECFERTGQATNDFVKCGANTPCTPPPLHPSQAVINWAVGCLSPLFPTLPRSCGPPSLILRVHKLFLPI